MSEGYMYDVAIQAVTDVEWRAVQAMYADWRDASRVRTRPPAAGAILGWQRLPSVRRKKA